MRMREELLRNKRPITIQLPPPEKKKIEFDLQAQSLQNLSTTVDVRQQFSAYKDRKRGKSDSNASSHNYGFDVEQESESPVEVVEADETSPKFQAEETSHI